MKYFFLFILLPVIFQSSSIVKWLTPIEHDFGDILYQEPAEFKFEFKNISGEPILIDNVRSTCGCTSPDWTWEPIEHDSTSHIRVVFDANKRGYFRKKIKVFFNSQRQAEVLSIEGWVE